MAYILITIAGFFSIISTAIFKSITKRSKHQILFRVLVVVVSLAVYIICCAFLIQQKTVE